MTVGGVGGEVAGLEGRIVGVRVNGGCVGVEIWVVVGGVGNNCCCCC